MVASLRTLCARLVDWDYLPDIISQDLYAQAFRVHKVNLRACLEQLDRLVIGGTTYCADLMLCRMCCSTLPVCTECALFLKDFKWRLHFWKIQHRLGEAHESTQSMFFVCDDNECTVKRCQRFLEPSI